jgi:HEAT repeat protein
MAMRHLRAAYESGHAEYRLEAAYWMGMFYWWDGTHGRESELRNAVIMLQQVVDSVNSRWGSDAGAALGSIREDFGDLE